MTDWIIQGGRCLEGGAVVARDLFIVDGCFAGAPAVGAHVFGADGLLLAPGIVDLHGDGFERNVSPRPNVFFEMDTAVIETDRQLIANGITTAYLALTISWEPGLRSIGQARKLVETLERLRPVLRCDIRLQLRWEIFALEAADQIKAWLTLDPTPTLAFNDHFTGLLYGGREGKKIPEYAARAGMREDAYRGLIREVGAREGEVPDEVARLAQAAQAAGVPCLAHDEKTPEVRAANRALGITISEFPLSRETARSAIDAGESTILGAPNVLRGGSHIGAVDAEPAIADGLCSVLASDYYYPSQMGAVAKMAGRDDACLAQRWPLISENPARAVAGGTPVGLAHGAPASLVALSPGQTTPMITAVFSGGRLAQCSDSARLAH